MLINGMVATSGRLLEGWIEIDGDRIVGVGGRPARRSLEHEGIIGPGLCDLQVNGAGGVNVTDGPEALDLIDEIQLRHGVTSYLPTIISTSVEIATQAVAEISKRVDDSRSPVEGIHLEGPFISAQFRGVHPEKWLVEPADGVPDYFGAEAVRLVTLAPELPGAMDLIPTLRRRGVVVSIGHTGATADEAKRALENGATAVTHLFNAMKPFHHRDINVPGMALLEPNLRLCVIPDGHHVAPSALKLVDRLARDRVILVTDATPFAGFQGPRTAMAGIEIHLENDYVTNGDGRLAGSCLTLDEGVRRWIRFTGCSLASALVAAAERPSRLLGLAHGIRAGSFADLVMFDSSGAVQRVMRRGRWVWPKD